MAPHSSTLTWKIPWTEEPGGLQSMGSHRVRHNWATPLSLFTFMHWRRKWQPTPVFLSGESQGRESLLGWRLWGRTESDTSRYFPVFLISGFFLLLPVYFCKYVSKCVYLPKYINILAGFHFPPWIQIILTVSLIPLSIKPPCFLSATLILPFSQSRIFCPPWTAGTVCHLSNTFLPTRPIALYCSPSFIISSVLVQAKVTSFYGRSCMRCSFKCSNKIQIYHICSIPLK